MPTLLKKDEAGSKPAGLLTQMVQIGRGNEEGSPGVRRARAVGTRELLHAKQSLWCGSGLPGCPGFQEVFWFLRVIRNIF